VTVSHPPSPLPRTARGAPAEVASSGSTTAGRGAGKESGMNARRPSMSAAFTFVALCAAMVLVLSAWPTSRARAQDDNNQGDNDNQGEDSCGGAIVGEDDDNQGDDNAQGDENGCGMM